MHTWTHSQWKSVEVNLARKGKIGQCSAKKCFHSWRRESHTETKARVLTERLKRNQNLLAVQVQAHVTVCPVQPKPTCALQINHSPQNIQLLSPISDPSNQHMEGLQHPVGLVAPQKQTEWNGCSLKSRVGPNEVCQSAFNHSRWQRHLWQTKTYFGMLG